MKKKYKLYNNIIFGVLVASTLFSNSCAGNKHDSDLIDETLGMNDLIPKTTLNHNDTNYKIDSLNDITAPIEPVISENNQLGYKISTNYVPYQVDENYSMPGMIEIAEKTDEYNILVAPYRLVNGEKIETSFEGAIGVYEPYAHLLSSKNLILAKYGLTSSDVSLDYSFASLEDQELLTRISYIEGIVRESYTESKVLKLTR